jgi:hypothetical protein
MYQNHSTPIFVGRKVVGRVEGDVFSKSIRGSRHMLRHPRALAFDVSTLNEAEMIGAKWVEVFDLDYKTVYRASIRLIWEKGRRFSRGFGEQIFLTLENFTITRPGGPVQLGF